MSEDWMHNRSVLLTFGQEINNQAARGGALFGSRTVWKGGVSPWGGRKSIPGGVKRFRSSLCATPFCSGFVGRYCPVSWLSGVYSWGERALFPSCHTHGSSTPEL